MHRGLLYRTARLIPAVVLDQPWAIFIKALCFVSGLTTFAGPKPGTIEATLPTPIVYGWATTLVAGSLLGLIGLGSRRRQHYEVAGLIWLGTAATVYAVTIALRFGSGGAVAAGIVFAFGLSAFVRALAVYLTVELARQRVRR
jgi:hypothetical protein